MTGAPLGHRGGLHRPPDRLYRGCRPSAVCLIRGTGKVLKASNWIVGGCAAVLSIGALFVASRAGHGMSYYAGLAVFAFLVLFIFNLIRSGTGNR